MARNKASIPILGIDERPLERQKNSGVCTNIENLRPTGLKEAPNWKVIPEYDFYMVNNVLFNHTKQSAIVRMFWHVRGVIGKHGDYKGSLKRLICLFNDGSIELIDPSFKGAAWVTIARYELSSALSGEWNASFTQLYDAGYICISKGGVPVANLIIQDDLILSATFPEPPRVSYFFTESEKTYTKEEVDAGVYTGARMGSFYYMYALRLNNGELVMHSLPKLAKTWNFGSDPNIRTTIMKWYMHDLEYSPDHIEYWKSQIKGVTILVSDFMSDASNYAGNYKAKLEELNFYEAVSFDFFDTTDKGDNERIVEFTMNTEQWSNLPVAGVDVNSRHKISNAVAKTYNSRLIQGVELVSFELPVFSDYIGKIPFMYYLHNNAFYLYPVNQEQSLYTYTRSFSGLNNCDPQAFSDNSNRLAFDLNISNPVNDWGFILDVTFEGSVYRLVVNKNINQERDVIKADSVFYRVVSGPTRKMILAVEIESDYDTYQRVMTKSVEIPDSLAYTYPVPNIIQNLYYRDLRGKKILLYEERSGTYDMVAEYALTPSKKQNFSYCTISPQRNSGTLNPSRPFVDTIDYSVNDKNYLVRNKVTASTMNSLFSLDAALNYRIGGSDTFITAFAVNAIEVSQGQFGQYPLFVFKKSDIWALEQSGSAEVVFARVSPVNTSIGVDNEDMIINADQTIVFATKEGLFLMSGVNTQKISDPVKSILPRIIAIGFLRINDNREIWCATSDGNSYIYSLEYGYWYKDTLGVNAFFKNGEHLYAQTYENTILDFRKLSPVTSRNFSVAIDNLHFGLPDILKRFFYFYLRAELLSVTEFKATLRGKDFTAANYQLRPRMGSVYDASISIKGKMDSMGGQNIHKIDTEFDTRYNDRIQNAEV